MQDILTPTNVDLSYQYSTFEWTLMLSLMKERGTKNVKTV